MATSRQWLDVPFAQIGDAKRAGARWDGRRRQWWAPRNRVAELVQWSARGDLPELLPGEDRSLGGAVLFIDMVPSSCWFTNVRSCVDEIDWDRIRRMVYGRAGHQCEVCGATPDREAKQWLEAHERWEYDDATSTQRLRRLIALCTPCHTATHFGYAEGRGLAAQARQHIAAVNGWTPSDVELHIEGAAELWYALDQRTWELDLSILNDAGVTVTRPPAREERAWRARELP